MIVGVSDRLELVSVIVDSAETASNNLRHRPRSSMFAFSLLLCNYGADDGLLLFLQTKVCILPPSIIYFPGYIPVV